VPLFPIGRVRGRARVREVTIMAGLGTRGQTPIQSVTVPQLGLPDVVRQRGVDVRNAQLLAYRNGSDATD